MSVRLHDRTFSPRVHPLHRRLCKNLAMEWHTRRPFELRALCAANCGARVSCLSQQQPAAYMYGAWERIAWHVNKLVSRECLLPLCLHAVCFQLNAVCD